MHRPIRFATYLGCAGLLLAAIGPGLAAQAVMTQGADVLGRMRADFSKQQYSAVLATGNALLESARTISTEERIAVWQLMAASYYPVATDAQQPDSAQLPLAALVRLVPDIKIAKELSWPGLDSLTDKVRAETFAVATRPLTEYLLSARAPAHLTVVASRPTRFRLVSVAADGRRVLHDQSAFVTVAALQIRSHEAGSPVFTDGAHELGVWAVDSLSGDSVYALHRLTARRTDLAPASAPSEIAIQSARVSEPPSASVPKVMTLRRRSSVLWSGLALAVVTAGVAQAARPDDVIGSSFKVDGRAFAVGGAMAAGAVANYFTRREAKRAPLPRATVVPTVRKLDSDDRYQVRLLVDPTER